MLIFVTALLEMVTVLLKSIDLSFLFLKAPFSAAFAKQLEYSSDVLLLFTECFITCKPLASSQ